MLYSNLQKTIRIVVYLFHARTSEPQKPQNTHATVYEAVFFLCHAMLYWAVLSCTVLVARQRCFKHNFATVDQHTPVEEAVFSVCLVLHGNGGEGLMSIPRLYK
jgi:hypothetical protein